MSSHPMNRPAPISVFSDQRDENQRPDPAYRTEPSSRSELGQNLVLGLDLLLQVCNPLLVSGMVARPSLLEGRSPVLEEFLLPAVEDCRLESHFVAQLRDGLLLQQVPPQDG